MKKFITVLAVLFLMVSCEKESLYVPDTYQKNTEDSSVDNNKASKLKLSLLPNPSLFFGYANDINNQGIVVGDGVWVNGEHSFLDTYLDGSFEYTEGSSINNQGQIVGFSSDFYEYLLPAYWENYGADITILPTDSYLDGYAYGINSQGAIVGFVGYPNTYPALWVNNELTVLPTGSAPYGRAQGINNQGQIVGFLTGAANQPALWENGQLQLLPMGGYTNGLAWGINNNGRIVGTVGNQPAYWDHGQLTLLPTGGYGSGFANAINNNMTIVGEVGGHPAMWINGELSLLPEGDYNSGFGYSINDPGKVIGNLYGDDGVGIAIWQ